MKKRVRVTKLPNASAGMEVRMGGSDIQRSAPHGQESASAPDLSVSSYVNAVPRDQANIEAEKGETIITPMGDDARTKSIPKTFVVDGKKHHSGGTPLNVPDGTFVFSDHLKETNMQIHPMFNKKEKKSGYTYADLSKPYMLNKDISRLIDESSDKISQNTAKMNIQNKVDKLSLLAILQESKKGFGKGEEFDMPEVAMPYLERSGLDIAQAVQPYIDTVTQSMAPQQPQGQQMAKYGGPMIMKDGGGVRLPRYDNGGGVKGLKPGHRVDRTTGLIYDASGKEVGMISSSGQTAEVKPTKKASIPKDATVIKRTDYATDAEYITARDAAFNAALAKKQTIYTQDASGAYKKVVQKGADFEPYKGELFSTVFNNNQDVADQYYYVQQKFNTPEAKKALQERSIAALKDSKNVRGLSQSQINTAIKKLQDNPDMAYNQFMDMQQRNMGLMAHSKDAEGKEIKDMTPWELPNNPTPGDVTNKEFKKAWETAGLKAPTKEEAALQQATYIGYRDLLADRDAGKITDPKLLENLKRFNIAQIGKSDDIIVGDKPGSISAIDSIYTNTTAGQIAGIAREPGIFEAELEGEKNTDSNIKINPITGAKSTTPYGWRAPDLKRLWSAQRNLTSDVEEQPFTAKPEYYMPPVYLESPEARAFNERGAIANLENTLGTYATPGALLAGASGVTGAGNVGQYIAEVGSRNKDRLNQHALQTAAVLNQAASERAQLATAHHDKGVAVREKGRAFKREARNAWDNAYDWGYNKAAELALINERAAKYNRTRSTIASQ